MKSSALLEALKMHKTSLKDGKEWQLMNQVCCKILSQGENSIHRAAQMLKTKLLLYRA